MKVRGLPGSIARLRRTLAASRGRSPIDWLRRESLHHACEPDRYLLDTP